MSEEIKFKIDGKEIIAKTGQTIVEAAKENGVYIPTLCNFSGVKPKGSCRICSVKINNRFMTACSTPAAPGMEVESNTEEISDFRKSIIELLFVSGNHFCPSCEKSGNCELQALAYKYQMMVPRFPYNFKKKGIVPAGQKILKDQDRCIMCQRCMKTIKDEDGRHYFAFNNRGKNLEVVMDEEMSKTISDELAKKAMENCPVGSIIYKEIGYATPIGNRKYDKQPIGSDIETI
jgi:[NiFe] hydrogenase diaphorase moiety small subunit